MTTPVQSFEAAIVGGGPAGAALALTLARSGRRVLLIERGAGLAFKVGEGLPPAARPLLRDLGVLERFLADGHLPSYGNQSAWGSRALHCTDFIRDPNGHGWHLDRRRFDAMFREAARGAGAEVRLTTRITHCARTVSPGWRLTLTASDDSLGAAPMEVHAQCLADCTGRSARLARSQGARRTHHDRLLAFVALFNPPQTIGEPETMAEPDRDSLTLIESSAHGWWYSARLPTGQRVAVYHTDSDSVTGKAVRSVEGFAALLWQTEHIRVRLAAHGYTIAGAPRATAANSARLEQFVGDDWLAAGDAALSFDPLSSQGILTALYSGLKAGHALHAHLSGDAAALDLYSQGLAAVHDVYLKNRTAYYSQERRWPESEFWQRRREQDRFSSSQ